MRTPTFALIAAAVLVAVPAHAADLYRWVDDAGRINYGDTVPEKYRQKASKVEGGVTVLSSTQLRGMELPVSAEPAKPVARKQPVAGSATSR